MRDGFNLQDFEERVERLADSHGGAMGDVLRDVRVLLAENARLRKALQPFAHLADITIHPTAQQPRDGELHTWVHPPYGERSLTVEMLVEARAALAEGTPTNKETSDA